MEKSGKRAGDESGSLVALFGAYGGLALALMLFALQEFVLEQVENER